MKTKKSQESQRLLDSVKEKYNDPGELELRIEDLKIGISEAEQAFVERFPAGSRLLDIDARQDGCALHLRGKDITSPVLMSLKNRLNKHSNLLKRNASTRHFYNMKCRLCLFPMPHLPLHLWECLLLCPAPRIANRFFGRDRACAISKWRGFNVSDSPGFCAGKLRGVYDDNYHQFAPNYDTLEEGDGFVLGAPHYLHFSSLKIS